MDENDLICIDHAPPKRFGCGLSATEMLDAGYAAAEVGREAYLQRNSEMS